MADGRRIGCHGGATGTAREADGQGRRWVVLDGGGQAWLRQDRLEPLDGLGWSEADPTVPCRTCGLREGRLYPGGRWCDECSPYRPAPVPDPARTLDALRASPAAGPAAPRAYGDTGCAHEWHARLGPARCPGCRPTAAASPAAGFAPA